MKPQATRKNPIRDKYADKPQIDIKGIAPWLFVGAAINVTILVAVFC